MKKEDIDRINELAVVGDLRQQLDNTYIVDSKGNKRKLRQ